LKDGAIDAIISKRLDSFYLLGVHYTNRNNLLSYWNYYSIKLPIF